MDMFYIFSNPVAHLCLIVESQCYCHWNVFLFISNFAKAYSVSKCNIFILVCFQACSVICISKLLSIYETKE